MAKHKVHFFVIGTSQNEPSNAATFETICSEIVKLPVAEKSLQISDTVSYRLTYFAQTGDHYQGKVVKYRTNHMITGSLTNDELTDFTLEEGRKFTEVTYFIYSPETKILTFEYNQHGPRHGMFLGYLGAIQTKYRADVCRFVGTLLMHPDVLQKLSADTKRIKSITVGVPVAKIPTAGQTNNLLMGLKAASKFGNAGQVYITVAGSKRRGDTTPLISTDGILQALNTKEIDLDLFGKAEVQVVTDFGSETINLLENKLEATKEWNVPITNDNADRWFSDIRTLYQTNKPLLMVALQEYEQAI